VEHDIASALEFWGSEKFAAELQDLIGQGPNATVLPLEDYAQNGGSIDYWDITIDDLKHGEPEGDWIYGTFWIRFAESYHAGCRDITWDDTYEGTMHFQFNIKTGEFSAECGDDITQVLDEEPPNEEAPDEVKSPNEIKPSVAEIPTEF
jgi:hypothetical protein